MQGKIAIGERPFVDPRYQNRSWEERQLVEIMRRGWEQDSRRRMDIFEAVRLLRQATKHKPSGM